MCKKITKLKTYTLFELTSDYSLLLNESFSDTIVDQ